MTTLNKQIFPVLKNHLNITTILKSRSPRFTLKFNCGTNKHLNLPIYNLVFAKSEGSLSILHFDVGDKLKKVTTSECLKDLEAYLKEFGFFRSHRQYLVNISYVNSKEKLEEDNLILFEGTTIPIARRRKAEVLNLLKK